ncbi:MAG: MmcQ/YjbR family DNA-binding protein [Acidobacteria bacterium]|nr:MmcQ/YjbR family DNA-binding protein [Acidobacteriota bacterium]
MHLELDAKGRKYLEKFRKIALALPDVAETESFGHPWFRAGGPKGKVISVFGNEGGHWSVCFKVGKASMSLFLADPRFVKTPYIGNHGWVSLLLDAKKPNWDEVEELLRTSYRNNAAPKLVAKNKV